MKPARGADAGLPPPLMLPTGTAGLPPGSAGLPPGVPAVLTLRPAGDGKPRQLYLNPVAVGDGCRPWGGIAVAEAARLGCRYGGRPSPPPLLMVPPLLLVLPRVGAELAVVGRDMAPPKGGMAPPACKSDGDLDFIAVPRVRIVWSSTAPEFDTLQLPQARLQTHHRTSDGKSLP